MTGFHKLIERHRATLGVFLGASVASATTVPDGKQRLPTSLARMRHERVADNAKMFPKNASQALNTCCELFIGPRDFSTLGKAYEDCALLVEAATTPIRQFESGKWDPSGNFSS